MKVNRITYNRRKKNRTGKVLWQKLRSWSAKRSQENALILDMLDIAQSEEKKEHLENYFKCL